MDSGNPLQGNPSPSVDNIYILQVLMADESDPSYRESAHRFLNDQMMYKPKTPQGMMWQAAWGANRYAG